MMAVQGQGLLAVWTDIPAAMAEDFDHWYDAVFPLYYALRLGIAMLGHDAC
jgi:hypothetical protein